MKTLKTFLKAVLPVVALLMMSNSASAQEWHYDPPYTPCTLDAWVSNNGYYSAFLSGYYPFTVTSSFGTSSNYSLYVSIDGGKYSGQWRGRFDNNTLVIVKADSTGTPLPHEYPVVFTAEAVPGYTVELSVYGYTGRGDKVDFRMYLSWGFS